MPSLVQLPVALLDEGCGTRNGGAGHAGAAHLGIRVARHGAPHIYPLGADGGKQASIVLRPSAGGAGQLANLVHRAYVDRIFRPIGVGAVARLTVFTQHEFLA